MVSSIIIKFSLKIDHLTWSSSQLIHRQLIKKVHNAFVEKFNQSNATSKSLHSWEVLCNNGAKWIFKLLVICCFTLMPKKSFDNTHYKSLKFQFSTPESNIHYTIWKKCFLYLGTNISRKINDWIGTIACIEQSINKFNITFYYLKVITWNFFCNQLYNIE